VFNNVASDDESIYVDYKDTMGNLSEIFNEQRMGKSVIVKYEVDLVFGY
jgi:hypothetical protein